MKKTGMIVGFITEVLLIIILLFYTDDIRYFFLYFLIVFYINAAIWGNYLRKLITVFQLRNEIKLLSITRKLEISDEEGQVISDEVENNLTEEQRKLLYKDMDSLGL